MQRSPLKTDDRTDAETGALAQPGAIELLNAIDATEGWTTDEIIPENAEADWCVLAKLACASLVDCVVWQEPSHWYLTKRGTELLNRIPKNDMRRRGG